MAPTAVVYESPLSGERFELEVPLRSARDLGELRAELGLPDYVDVRDTQVARALGVLWAAEHAPALAGLSSPLRLAVFGGVAVRLLSRRANEAAPFRRRLGDVDLVTTRADGPNAVKLLTGMGATMGSRYWHAATKSDEMFNALRRGRRYRLHGAEERDDGSVGACVLDLLVDEIAFCHTVDVADALADAGQQRHTIGATHVLLTKLQAIRALDPAEVDDEHRYRVIAEHGSKLLIGPEDKDLVDVAALLLDSGVGSRPGQIDPERLGRALASDWRLAQTVRLNVAHVPMYERALRDRGAPDGDVELVARALGDLLAVIDDPRHQPRRPRLRLTRTWWEEVEDT
jgi:hypothetical protein